MSWAPSPRHLEKETSSTPKEGPRANGMSLCDLKDPMLSPVYGDLQGFLPTILTLGTSDLFLSNTVRCIASYALRAS
jgi:hypothetical protein